VGADSRRVVGGFNELGVEMDDLIGAMIATSTTTQAVPCRQRFRVQAMKDAGLETRRVPLTYKPQFKGSSGMSESPVHVRGGRHPPILCGRGFGHH